MVRASPRTNVAPAGASSAASATNRALEDAGMRARLILQVHDEVILDVPPEEEADAERATRAAMEGAADLRVPLVVNLTWGDTWADAKL